MRRRQLLQLGALAPLSLFLPRRSDADQSGYDGPYFIALHASGGWDTTLFCDAKKPNDYIQQRLYSAPKVLGNGMNIAPIPLSNYGTTLDTVEGFWNELGSQFLVVNGVDTQTNNHDVGVKHVWSGRASDVLPSCAALLASQVSAQQQLPAAYLSTGGYDTTAELVPLTRLSGGADLARIARPLITNPGEPPMNWQQFQSSATQTRLAAARTARLERLLLQSESARLSQSLRSFREAKKGAAGFAALADVLPQKLVEVREAFPGLSPGYEDYELRLYLQSVQTALLAFKSKQAAAASLIVYNFDTHANHDNDHTRQLGRLLLTIRYLMTQATALGLANKLYVVVGSDFGRTPIYNVGNGKDHWNVTSMMFAGPGIRGGRVLGGTDDQLRPLSVNKNDPTVLLGYDDPQGTRILPAHVQRALRKKLGLNGHASDPKYALPVETPLDDLLS